MDLPSLLAKAEQEAILQALDVSKGNHSQAARILGISRSSLLDRINRYGLRGSERIRTLELQQEEVIRQLQALEDQRRELYRLSEFLEHEIDELQKELHGTCEGNL